MSPFTIGIIGIAIMILMLFLGVHIGVAMSLVGLGGIFYLTSLKAGLPVIATVFYSNMASYTMSVVPLFVGMGIFCSYAGMSKGLYSTAYKWVGSFRGGLSIATVAACAGFAAVSGTSVGTAATIGKIALPEMKKYNYDGRLATGCVAAGGTLGILIPPSTVFIIYGLLTEQSIGKLFVAGILPGILLSSLFILTIFLMTRKNPELGPPGPETSLREKIASLKDVWSVLFLFVIVIGGLYFGVFTPTEAGGIGAFLALFIGVVTGKLNWSNLGAAFLEVTHTTAMIFLIIIGSMIFNVFMAVSQFPTELSSFLSGMDVNRYVIFAGMVCIYLILGCLMDMFAMLVLTIPVFFPIIKALGFDPIWFGVIIVIMMEQALITPPVGLNVYVISGMAKDVPMGTIFRGIFPFWLAMLVCVLLLTIFPRIALFLVTF
jgi:C4-dicarboxylate transporter, DctM subunit